MKGPSVLFRRALLKKSLAKARDRLGYLLFPPTCGACGQAEILEGQLFCSDCESDLPLLADNLCRRCATPMVFALPEQASDKPRCPNCINDSLQFDEAVAAGGYEGLLRDLVLRAKHVSDEAVASTLGELIWRQQGDKLQDLKPDVVASIPMHWSRRLVRQANSPELIAAALAQHLQVPLAIDLLRRTRPTAKQSTLPQSSRADNVRRSFGIGWGQRLQDTTVLLVDDILTTGATASSAASVLKKAGANRVVLVVAARTL